MQTACPYHTEEVHEWHDAETFLAEVRRRGRLVDVLLILIVPVVLVAVHLSGAATRQALALDYAAPTIVTAYTANFVHVGWAHLAENLVAYLLVVPASYLLSVLSNRRRHFLALFVAFLVVCPFVLSATQLPFISRGIGVGFSGVVMSFFGYASLVLVGYLSTRFSASTHLDHAPLLFFAEIAAVGAITVPFPLGGVDAVAASPVPPSYAGVIVVAVSLGAAVIYLVQFLRELEETPGTLLGLGEGAGYAELAVSAVGVLFALLAMGFADTESGGVVVNLLSHFVGFASGFLFAYLALRTDCSVSHVCHCAAPDTTCLIHDSPMTRLLRRVLVDLHLC